MHGSQIGFPQLGAADLRTLAKARQNRMWKIEFTKQLSTELIYILHRGEQPSEREKELKREGERGRATDHGSTLKGHRINKVCRGTALSPSHCFLELSVYASIHLVNLHIPYCEGGPLHCVLQSCWLRVCVFFFCHCVSCGQGVRFC